ncbi:MAG: hypothetical protein OXF20_05405 [Gammaproteobacteria bacterium]|nr:hypothetical protein [Gammaproteobacteria bacterium]
MAKDCPNIALVLREMVSCTLYFALGIICLTAQMIFCPASLLIKPIKYPLGFAKAPAFRLMAFDLPVLTVRHIIPKKFSLWWMKSTYAWFKIAVLKLPDLKKFSSIIGTYSGLGVMFTKNLAA